MTTRNDRGLGILNGTRSRVVAIDSAGRKSQGMTADKAFVLADETLYKEWGYVALSRGRDENHRFPRDQPARR